MVFNFLHTNCQEKYFLSFCLLLWKQWLILEVLPEATSEFQVTCVFVILSSFDNNTGSASKRMGNINSALKKPTANHPTVILKSYTVTFFKIVSGLQNNLQNHRRPPECLNKYFEEGYGLSSRLSLKKIRFVYSRSPLGSDSLLPADDDKIVFFLQPSSNQFFV